MAPTPDWIDLTPALRYSVYMLRLHGRVVFIGHGRVPLERIAQHRMLERQVTAPWMPFRGVRFDEVLIRPSHPDRAPAEVAALIIEHDPPANRPYIPPEPARLIVRRQV